MRRFVPLNHQIHRTLRYRPNEDFSFAREVSQIELIITEIWQLASRFPTVFLGPSPESITPIAIIGRPGQTNGLVTRDGAWNLSTLPSLLKIYPFALERPDDGQMRILIDESSACFDGLADTPLFNEDGTPSRALEGLMALFQSVHAGLLEAQTLGRVASELDLLSVPNQHDAFSDEPYYIVEMERLNALSDAQLITLRNRNWLPVLYAMALSVQFDLDSHHPVFWTRVRDDHP